MTRLSSLALALAVALATSAGLAAGFMAGSARLPAPRIVVIERAAPQPPAPRLTAPPPCPALPAHPEISLEVARVAPGEAIRFSVKRPEALGPSAWVGLIPSQVPHGSEQQNDANDLDYRYITTTPGSYSIAAPTAPGRYDLRLHDRYPGGVEIDSVEVVVQAPQGGDRLGLDRSQVLPGAVVSVRFDAPSAKDDTAWIGVVPAATPHGSEEVNDSHDLSYRYLGTARRGSIQIEAPAEPGVYDVRLNDTDSSGRELASARLVVIGAVER